MKDLLKHFLAKQSPTLTLQSTPAQEDNTTKGAKEGQQEQEKVQTSDNGKEIMVYQGESTEGEI